MRRKDPWNGKLSENISRVVKSHRSSQTAAIHADRWNKRFMLSLGRMPGHHGPPEKLHPVIYLTNLKKSAGRWRGGGRVKEGGGAPFLKRIPFRLAFWRALSNSSRVSQRCPIGSEADDGKGRPSYVAFALCHLQAHQVILQTGLGVTCRQLTQKQKSFQPLKSKRQKTSTSMASKWLLPTAIMTYTSMGTARQQRHVWARIIHDKLSFRMYNYLYAFIMDAVVRSGANSRCDMESGFFFFFFWQFDVALG